MKNLIFIFTIVLFTNYSIGQIIHQDTSKTSYNFYSGILTEKAFDSGTYVYATSNYNSYIEFALPYFGRSNAIYRVEKLLNGEIFIITKTYLTKGKSVATCFLAIDSIVADKIKMKKKGLNYLKKNRVYEDMKAEDSMIFYYISMYIMKHKIQSNFLNFNPKSLVAWLKIKN